MEKTNLHCYSENISGNVCLCINLIEHLQLSILLWNIKEKMLENIKRCYQTYVLKSRCRAEKDIVSILCSLQEQTCVPCISLTASDLTVIRGFFCLFCSDNVQVYAFHVCNFLCMLISTVLQIFILPARLKLRRRLLGFTGAIKRQWSCCSAR